MIEEPVVFFGLGLVAGVYAKGAFGDCDPRHAIQRAELRRAMRRGEVVFYYQPLADARTRRVVGFESWRAGSIQLGVWLGRVASFPSPRATRGRSGS